jgi:DNA-binding CsgD family transcriptional regulator/photosystem II stability/assembly factor-like uncharacterized protein
MGRRGRPPHPDVLTPREWEVLALLRDELTNEEIAGRLGISIDGVKFHVSEILSKLGVSTRQEAAAWSEERRPWWLAAAAPVGFVWRRTASFAARLSPLATALAGGLLVVALAGLALLAFFIVHTDNSSPDTEVPQAGVIPTPVDGWAGTMTFSFVDGMHGWVPLRNVLFQTTDGGLTWNREYEAPDDIGSVFFLSPQAGWLLSGSTLNGSKLWRSDDGGRTWNDTGRTARGAVRFFDAVNGWATSQLEDQIWRTGDGGASWQVVQAPCPELARSENGATSTGGAPKVKVVSRPVSFIDPKTGWALCAESSQSGDDNKLFQTSDAGDDWKLLAVLPWDSISLQFIDERHGWLLNFAGLSVTNDGGHSWHQIAAFQPTGHIAPIFSDAHFVSTTNGFLSYALDLAGPSAIFGTQDGGWTWTQLYGGPPAVSAPEIRPCLATDIDAAMGGVGALTGGQLVSGIDFRNKSNTPCKVRGLPQIELLDSEGGGIPITVFSTCDENYPPCGHPLQDVVLAPDTDKLELHATLPRGHAWVSLYWPTYGTEGPPCSPPSVAMSIRLRLPNGGGDLTVPTTSPESPNGIGPCHRMGISWFQPSQGVP